MVENLMEVDLDCKDTGAGVGGGCSGAKFLEAEAMEETNCSFEGHLVWDTTIWNPTSISSKTASQQPTFKGPLGGRGENWSRLVA